MLGTIEEADYEYRDLLDFLDPDNEDMLNAFFSETPGDIIRKRRFLKKIRKEFE